MPFPSCRRSLVPAANLKKPAKSLRCFWASWMPVRWKFSLGIAPPGYVMTSSLFETLLAVLCLSPAR
jgi:hypothetical protein